MFARVQLAVAAGLLCIAVVLGVVLLTGDDSKAQALDIGPEGFAGSVRPAASAGDFTLRDQSGKAVTLDRYRGRPVVVSFMYSTCQDTCPIMAGQIRDALDSMGSAAKDVPVVLISVDPKNDTPARARRFLNEQRLTGRAEYLLGTEAQLRPVWTTFAIQPQETATGGYDHSSYVVLVDAQGRQRVSFPAEALTSAGLVHDLRTLQRDGGEVTPALPASSAS